MKKTIQKIKALFIITLGFLLISLSAFTQTQAELSYLSGINNPEETSAKNKSTDAPATDWQSVYEGALNGGNVFNDWIPIAGDWTMTSEGVKRSGQDKHGLLMLRLPVVKGAVRIDFEAKTETQPGDLGLYFGMKDGEFNGAAYFGLGTDEKQATVIRVPGLPPVYTTGAAVVAGQWYKVTVLREGGLLTLQVNGKTVATGNDTRYGYQGPYIGLYCPNEGIFRNVKVQQSTDSGLQRFLSREAALRESGFSNERFSVLELARDAANKQNQRDELRQYEGMDVRIRTTTERQLIYRNLDRVSGWGTIAKTPDGDLISAFTGDREAEDDPYGSICFVRSNNNGRSWTTPVTVADSPLGEQEAGIVALKSGTLLATWRTSAGIEEEITPEQAASLELARGLLLPANIQVRSQSQGAADKNELSREERWKASQASFTPEDREKYIGYWCATSTDGGKTWGSWMRTPVHSPHGPAVLRDGRLLYLGRTEIDGKPVLAAAESTDEGKTWQIVWKQSLHNYELLGINDPHAVQCPDGRIIALFRIAPTGWKRKGGEMALQGYVTNKLYQIESKDNGRTWTTPAITPMWGYPPHLTVLQDGRLLCTYGYRHDYIPLSQKACVSHDGGKTWDVQQEITVRGDTPDRHPGYPSSVETENGWITTVYSQSVAAYQLPGIYRTSWSVPSPPRESKESEKFKVEMADPVLVAAGPLEERRWGFYQFPGYRMSRKGTIVGGYQTADDSYGGGAGYSNTKYASHDGGKTWVPETEEDRKEKGPAFVTKEGIGLNYAGFKTMRPVELGIKPLQLPPSSVFPDAEIYRYADLPSEMRVIRMVRHAPDGTVEEFDAPFEFPDLGMIRFKVGQNSETGLVALDAPVIPAFVRWGNDEICELPDGTLLVIVAGMILPKSGDTAPYMATCLVASTDGGRSWKYRSTIMGSNPEQGWEGTEEASIIRRPNGTLVCIDRNEMRETGSPTLYITRSTDNGHTWEPVERLNDYTALPRMIQLDNGVVACLHGRPGNSLRFSNDPDCRVWSNPYILHPINGLLFTGWMDSTCGYTSLIALGKDRFLVVYSDFYHRDEDWTLHKAIKAREVKVTVKRK